MRLLLGSGGLRSEARRAIYFEEMKNHFKDCDEVVFIPYAGNDHADYTSKIIEFSLPSGVTFEVSKPLMIPLMPSLKPKESMLVVETPSY